MSLKVARGPTASSVKMEAAPSTIHLTIGVPAVESGGNETVRARLWSQGVLVGFELDVKIGRRGGEVPQGVVCLGVGEAPHQFLDGVIVREADLLGTTISGNSVSAGVLNLLNEVLVTLLGESATLLGVKVDVVGPDLEDRRVEVGGEVRR